MDGKKKPSERAGGRTPQPPNGARDGHGGSKAVPQSRSRGSTPTTADDTAAVVTSPSASGIAGARGAVAPRQPKITGTPSNNNSGSPRAANSARKPARDEPATDDDETAGRFQEPPRDEWLCQSEVTLAGLQKQVQEAAKRTLKHQHRCTAMQDAIAGKEERMDTLRGTYATLNRALDELESVSNGDLDSDALEELYNSIPADERTAALVHAE